MTLDSHVFIDQYVSKVMYPNVKFKFSQEQAATWSFVEKYQVILLTYSNNKFTSSDEWLIEENNKL